MKLLKSFALIVHWASFAFGTFIFLYFCSTLGWLARIALVGRVHFLPWRN